MKDALLLGSLAYNHLKRKSVQSLISCVVAPLMYRDELKPVKAPVLVDDVINVVDTCETSTEVSILSSISLNDGPKYVVVGSADYVGGTQLFKGLYLPSDVDIGYGQGLYKNLYYYCGRNFETQRPERFNRDGTYLRVDGYQGYVKDGCPCFKFEFYDNRYMYFGNVFNHKYENVKSNYTSGYVLMNATGFFYGEYVRTNVFELDDYGGSYGVSVKLSGIKYIVSNTPLFVRGVSLGGKSIFDTKIRLLEHSVNDKYIYDVRDFNNIPNCYLILTTTHKGQFRMRFLK